jgi:hypothetical protein
MRCMPMYTMVYKLTKVDTNDTCHYYAQECLILTCYDVNMTLANSTIKTLYSSPCILNRKTIT